MARVLAVLLAVGLIVYALVDLADSSEEERSGIPKGLWIVLILLLPYVGAIGWILMKRAAVARPASQPVFGPTARPGNTRRRTAPVAPDDDPDFLWRLEQERRERERRESPGRPDDADGTGAGGGGASGGAPTTP